MADTESNLRASRPAEVPELLQALDYILNQSDVSSIDVLSEAVIRRRRDLSVFNAIGGLPDPQGMAKQITERVNAGIDSGIENMRQSICEMIIRIIGEHAPELTDSQVDELCKAWLPDSVRTPAGSGSSYGAGSEKKEQAVPHDMLLSMIEQFISFSHGTMPESVNLDLRKEMGAWPERYWKVFPPVVQQLIADYLKEKISKADFYSRLNITLSL